jgi:N-acetyl-alpha-D-muramate 1-phosphate uridylyltransferase
MRKAMIFAAGLGTRLKPLTESRPKALVELEGKTMLERTVEKLIQASVKEIVINIHHFPELMHNAINNFSYPEVNFLISDESTELLDTGGGLLKASRWLNGNEPFIVHNVDVVSDIDLEEMYNFHLQSQALATLAMCNRQTTRYFLWHNNRLCGWQNIQTNNLIRCYPTPEEPIPLAFSGIHIINPEIFDFIAETGKFSINQVYLRLAYTHKIMSFTHNPEFWADVGTLEKHARALEMIKRNPEKF